MFSPAVRLNTQQTNENADSTSIARKPGQSQLHLRKAFHDCPNTPNVGNIIKNKKALGSIHKFTIKPDTPKLVAAEDLSKREYLDWACDLVSNEIVDVEERIPEFGKINIDSFFTVNKSRTPPPSAIDDFVFEIPKVSDYDYFDMPQMDQDIPEVEIPQPNFNDFAF